MLPTELFPTDVRSQAHGTCAAMGKFGALTATIVFTPSGVSVPSPANSPGIVGASPMRCKSVMPRGRIS
ncbi:MAG: hypothetical protein ACXVDJ_09855 [Tumebacillaceae bacterium]